MKTKEELNAIKEEVETLNKKLAELTEEELKAVAGGGTHVPKRPCRNSSGCTKDPANCTSHFDTNPSSPFICPKT